MMVRVRVHVSARSEVVGDSTHVQAIDSRLGWTRGMHYRHGGEVRDVPNR